MRIGILGNGQLAQMLALAGQVLHFTCDFFASDSTRATATLGKTTLGDLTDSARLEAFAKQVDIITFENENIPWEIIATLGKKYRVAPNHSALYYSQHRHREKNLFKKLAIPTNAFLLIENSQDLTRAVAELGLPLLLKTVSGGYDGKGQLALHTPDDMKKINFSQQQIYLAEEWVHFDREISCIGVRNPEGEKLFYPVVDNIHRQGILRKSIVAETFAPEITELAENAVSAIMDALDFVGVLVVEFFVQDGKLLANEMAPRVHNSGHWTLQYAATSQFENHLRAITGLPLGSTTATPCVMYNIIGQWPPTELLADIPKVTVMDYQKTPRTGRKLGHITLSAATAEKFADRLDDYFL